MMKSTREGTLSRRKLRLSSNNKKQHSKLS